MLHEIPVNPSGQLNEARGGLTFLVVKLVKDLTFLLITVIPMTRATTIIIVTATPIIIPIQV
jgi:hypothetical protein